MSALLDERPFAARDDAAFLAEINSLARWHQRGCPEFRRMWPNFTRADCLENLPFVHVGVFKRLLLKTVGDGIEHQRTVVSSGSTSVPSQVLLDKQSSAMQARSSRAILAELVGDGRWPLLIVDSVRSLRQRGQMAARVAAAMSLQPFASEIHFLTENEQHADQLSWETLRQVTRRSDRLLVYGSTSRLWAAWAQSQMPADVRDGLTCTEVVFVHSGGWKKLEAMRIERTQFEAALLSLVAPHSKVVDFYGLTEQVGVIFPLCTSGYRHAPRWAEVLVRDPWTLRTLSEAAGLLQFMNVLSRGAPYHSVLTEDLGRMVRGPCDCGWLGTRFEFLGRVPKSETRGCANA